MKNILRSALLLCFLSLFLHAAEQPVMKITDIHGTTHQVTGTEYGLRVKGLEGKIIFVEFFGHRCPPCLASIPHLIDLQKKYKDKLAIISIEVQGLTNTQLQQFAKQKGMNYIVVSDEKAGNFTNYIAQRAQWKGSIPFMVALDKSGNVQFMQPGMLPKASLEELVRQLDAIK
jgi:thiol-disulfide isomerase/thioredoxin